MRIRYAPLFAVVLLLGASGCGSDDDPAAPEDAAEAPADDGGGDGSVDIVDNDFDPAELEVAAGDTVAWENTGDVAHTVTFDDEDSGNLEPGDTFERTFEEAGEFDYVCSIHPTMEATVTVTG